MPRPTTVAGRNRLACGDNCSLDWCAVCSDVVDFSPELIFYLAEQKGIEKKELAETAGVTPTDFYIVCKRRRINYYKLDKIACFLGKHPFEFMT